MCTLFMQTGLRRYYSAEIMGILARRPVLSLALFVFMGDPGAHFEGPSLFSRPASGPMQYLV